jgi:hypothetical protein
MIETELTISILHASATENEKTDVAEHSETFPHVGLLFNEPPGRAGLSFT